MGMATAGAPSNRTSPPTVSSFTCVKITPRAVQLPPFAMVSDVPGMNFTTAPAWIVSDTPLGKVTAAVTRCTLSVPHVSDVPNVPACTATSSPSTANCAVSVSPPAVCVRVWPPIPCGVQVVQPSSAVESSRLPSMAIEHSAALPQRGE